MRTSRHILTAIATAVVLLCAACTPAPPPAPARTATTTTITTPPLTDPQPGFELLAVGPVGRYEYSFYPDVPTSVRTLFRQAAASATTHSGVQLVEVTEPSAGAAPRQGEIRVRIGALCNVADEAGCAVVWSADDTAIWGSDISITAAAAAGPLAASVIHHELGHALGLGHVTIDANRHHPQVMGNPRSVALTTWRPGDRRGLAASAARTASSASALSTSGELEATKYPHTSDGHRGGCGCGSC